MRIHHSQAYHPLTVAAQDRMRSRWRPAKHWCHRLCSHWTISCCKPLVESANMVLQHTRERIGKASKQECLV